MRRPSPLPQPSAPRAEQPEHTPGATAEGETAAGSTSPGVAEAAQTAAAESSAVPAAVSTATLTGPLTVQAHEVETVAPVIPLTAPTALPGMTPADGAEPDPAAPPIRVRDVWAAAQARRKALRAEVRRFTGRQRRRRMLWVAAAAAFLVLVLTTLAMAYSPLFAVERVRVVGAQQLDAADVEAALSGQVGTPLPLVDESAVKAALVTFPLVQSYTLEARPPHELVVRIVERLPIGLFQSRAGYTLVDAAGVVLSTTETPAAGRPLLTIAGGTGSAAFAATAQVMRSLPAAIRDQVTAISASTADDVTLTLGGTNSRVVWGSAEDSALKARVLEITMRTRPPESVTEYDVSSPAAIVVR